MYYPRKASLLQLLLLLACQQPPSLYAATLTTTSHTSSCIPPTLSFPLEDPQKTIQFQPHTHGYNAYLITQQEKGTLQEPLFLAFESQWDLPKLQKIAQKKQPTLPFLHLIPSNYPAQPTLLFIGPHPPRSHVQSIPELQTQQVHIRNQISLLQKKEKHLSTQIKQTQNTLYSLQSLLRFHNNELKNPKTYQEALQKSKYIETQLTQHHTQQKELQREIQYQEQQAQQYQQQRYKRSQITTCQKISLLILQIPHYLSQSILFKKILPPLNPPSCHLLVLQQNLPHEKINKKKKRLIQALYKQTKEEVKNLQQQYFSSQHQYQILQQEKQQVNRLLQQIHQFAPTHPPYRYYSFGYTPRLDYAQTLQKACQHLENNILNTKKECLRLRTTLQKNNHTFSQHPCYISLQHQQNTLEQQTFTLQQFQQVQKKSSRLTLSQQLALTNYTQTLQQEIDQCKQQRQQHQHERKRLLSLQKTLSTSSPRSRFPFFSRQSAPKENQRITHVRDALLYTIEKTQALQTTHNTLLQLKSQITQGLTQHSHELSIEALLLIEKNILDLERKASHHTSELNTTTQEAQQLLHQLTTSQQRLRQLNEAGNKKVLGGLALGGLLGGVLITCSGGLLTPFVVGGLYYAEIECLSGLKDKCDAVEKQNPKTLFFKALQQHIQRKKNQIKHLQTLAQQTQEEATIPTEAITFINNTTFYLQDPIQQLEKEANILQQDFDNLKEASPLKSLFSPQQKTFRQVLKSSSQTTQDLYQLCLKGKYRPLQQTQLHTSSSPQHTPTSVHLASLTPAQAEARLQAIQTYTNSLHIAQEENNALLQKLSQGPQALTTTQKETLQYLSYQQQNIQRELATLESEQLLLRNITQDLTLVSAKNTTLHANAYNKHELLDASQKLTLQIQTIRAQQQTLACEIQHIQTMLSDAHIQGSEVLLPILTTRLESLTSKRTQISLQYYLLHTQIQGNMGTLQERETRHTFLSIYLNMTLTATCPAPLAAGLKTLLAKPLESLIMHGGDTQAVQEDISELNKIELFEDVLTNTLVATITPRVKKAALHHLNEYAWFKNINLKPSEILKLPDGRIILTFQRNLVENIVADLTHHTVQTTLRHGDKIISQPQALLKQAKQYLSQCTKKEYLIHLAKKIGRWSLYASSATAAQEIGLARQQGTFDVTSGEAQANNWSSYLTHKLLHGGLGALDGVAHHLLENKTLEGAQRKIMAGALGAMSAEIFSEAYFNEQLAAMVAEAEAQKLTPKEFLEAYGEQIQTHLQDAAHFGKIGNITLAYGLGQDLHTAHRTGSNAIDHNFLLTALSVGMLALTIYDVCSILYEASKIYEEKGSEEALYYLAKQGAIEVVSRLLAMGAGKLIGKALKTRAAQKLFQEIEHMGEKGLKKFTGWAEKEAVKKAEKEAIKKIEKKALKKAEEKGIRKLQKKGINLKFSEEKNGKLAKHCDVLGYELSAQEAQKIIPELKQKTIALLTKSDPSRLRRGPWESYENAFFHICDGKMVVTRSDGTLITLIGKTSNRRYAEAIPVIPAIPATPGFFEKNRHNIIASEIGARGIRKFYPIRHLKARENDAVINPRDVHLDFLNRYDDHTGTNDDQAPSKEEQADTSHNPTP